MPDAATVSMTTDITRLDSAMRVLLEWLEKEAEQDCVEEPVIVEVHP